MLSELLLMSHNVIMCPYCRHVVFRGHKPAFMALHKETVMECKKCHKSYLNIWRLDEPALRPYDEYETAMRGRPLAGRDGQDLEQRWRESDRRLRDKSYAMSLACAEYPVPKKYLPEGFRPLIGAMNDESSYYAILRASPFAPQEDIEGLYGKRVRELDPIETGLSEEETRKEVTKLVVAYNTLKDPQKRRLYDLNYMGLPNDSKVSLMRPMWVFRQ